MARNTIYEISKTKNYLVYIGRDCLIFQVFCFFAVLKVLINIQLQSTVKIESGERAIEQLNNTSTNPPPLSEPKI